MYPSYLAQIFTGLLLLYVIILIIYRFNDPSGNDLQQHFNEYVVVLLLAIAVGVHGLQHAYAEVNFDFNPLNCRWHYRLGDKDEERLMKK